LPFGSYSTGVGETLRQQIHRKRLQSGGMTKLNGINYRPTLRHSEEPVNIPDKKWKTITDTALLGEKIDGVIFRTIHLGGFVD
jgi:hypothetical protein